MWLFGGAFGVGGKKRGRLRYRHENVLKKTSRYKMLCKEQNKKSGKQIKRQLLIKLLGSCLNYNLI